MALQIPRVNSFKLHSSFPPASPWLLIIAWEFVHKLPYVSYFYALKQVRKNIYLHKLQMPAKPVLKMKFILKFQDFRQSWRHYSCISIFKYNQQPVMSMNPWVLFLKTFVAFNLPELFCKDFPWQTGNKRNNGLSLKKKRCSFGQSAFTSTNNISFKGSCCCTSTLACKGQQKWQHPFFHCVKPESWILYWWL